MESNKDLRKHCPWPYGLAYLFITYIVTSKPKRISVAAGVVHMVLVLIYDKQDYLLRKLCVFCDTKYISKNIKHT